MAARVVSRAASNVLRALLFGSNPVLNQSGVAFAFHRNVAITPFIAIPFSAGSSDVILTVDLSFHVGG